MDAPVLTVTKTNPKEGEEITFTCTEKTSDSGVAYKWYFDDNAIGGQSGKTMTIAGKRAEDGIYHCTTTTTNFLEEVPSNNVTIKYLCESIIFLSILNNTDFIPRLYMNPLNPTKDN